MMRIPLPSIARLRTVLLALAMILGTLPILSAPALAITEVPAPVVAVVDVEGVIVNSAAYRSVMDQIRVPYREKIVEPQEALRREEESLKQQRAILSPQVYRQKVEEFEKKAYDVQKRLMAYKRKFDLGRGKIRKKLQRLVLEIVETIAVETDVNLVLSKAQVVLVKNTLDISDEVLRRLDDMVPTATVEFSESFE